LSEKNPPESPGPDLGSILNAAFAVGDLAEKAPLPERIEALEERLASIEPLLEQLQGNAALGTKLNDYVDDLRAEQVFFNRARYAVGGLAAVAVVGLVLLLVLSIFHVRSPLLAAPPIAIATFVIGMVSGLVLLLGTFIKGVFRSTAERHADGFLPPALEKGLEVFNKVTGKH
jgi:tetrahydromethanopterin S-methyltransferase subunit F